MLSRLRARYGRTSLLLFAAVYLFAIVIIIRSLHNPLWFDEAWRADFIDLNMRVPVADKLSYAPMSFGLYLFGKVATLVYDNNVTVRLSSYLAFMALPVISYEFTEKFLNKRTAQVVLVVGMTTGYVLEFSTQNKPYILDIVCVLGLLLAYHSYRAGKLRLGYFIGLTLVAMLLSFGALFLMPCLACLLAIDYHHKYRTRKQLRNGIIWIASIGISGLIYFVCFIRSQLTHQLDTYWQSLYPHGGITGVLTDTVSSFLSMFGLSFTRSFIGGAGLENFSVVWIDQTIIVGHKIVIGLSTITGSIALGLFLYGMWLLYKERRRTLLVSITGLFVIEWVASLLNDWPFANARTNLFSTFLVMIVICYAATKLLPRIFKAFPKVTVIILLVITILIFPYQSLASTVRDGFLVGQGETLNVGMEHAALFVAARSKPSDVILIDYYSGSFGFQYYYQFSDYTQQYRHRSWHIDYAYKKRDPLLVTPQLLQQHPATVWIVDIYPLGQPERISELYHDGYHQTAYEESGFVVVERLSYRP